jgi:hypothetical protein
MDVEELSGRVVASLVGLTQSQVYPLRDRARHLVRTCLIRRCRETLPDVGRRLLDLVELQRLPVPEAARRLAADFVHPDDESVPNDQRERRREQRAWTVLADVRDRMRRCLDQYEGAEIRVEELGQQDADLRDEGSTGPRS